MTYKKLKKPFKKVVDAIALIPIFVLAGAAWGLDWCVRKVFRDL